jgi:hypothetical protein
MLAPLLKCCSLVAGVQLAVSKCLNKMQDP